MSVIAAAITGAPPAAPVPVLFAVDLASRLRVDPSSPALQSALLSEGVVGVLGWQRTEEGGAGLQVLMPVSIIVPLPPHVLIAIDQLMRSMRCAVSTDDITVIIHAPFFSHELLCHTTDTCAL